MATDSLTPFYWEVGALSPPLNLGSSMTIQNTGEVILYHFPSSGLKAPGSFHIRSVRIFCPGALRHHGGAAVTRRLPCGHSVNSLSQTQPSSHYCGTRCISEATWDPPDQPVHQLNTSTEITKWSQLSPYWIGELPSWVLFEFLAHKTIQYSDEMMKWLGSFIVQLEKSEVSAKTDQINHT